MKTIITAVMLTISLLGFSQTTTYYRQFFEDGSSTDEVEETEYSSVVYSVITETYATKLSVLYVNSSNDIVARESFHVLNVQKLEAPIKDQYQVRFMAEHNNKVIYGDFYLSNGSSVMSMDNVSKLAIVKGAGVIINEVSFILAVNKK